MQCEKNKEGETMAKKMSFEKAMERLESIVSRLEDGNVPLDESIKLYEEGMKLGKICRKMLDEAQAKIKKLEEYSLEEEEESF